MKDRLIYMYLVKLILKINLPKKSHTSRQLHLCYCRLELMKNTMPGRKMPVCFCNTKNPDIFHELQKVPFGKNLRPKKILRTPHPSQKYVSGPPGVKALCRSSPKYGCACMLPLALVHKLAESN